MKFCRHSLVSGLLLSLLALRAGAVDGVIEINQVAAEAGLVTASDGPGFPVTIDTAGSYRLTSELVVLADVTGIEVLAPDVSIDLNGFTIRGPATCSGQPPALVCSPGVAQGIHSVEPATRVANGTVTGFGDGGVVLDRLAFVSEVLAYANGRVGIEIGVQGQVKHSRANGNDGDGFIAGSDSLAIGNNATANSGLGAALGFGAGLSTSIVSGNGAGATTGGVALGDNVCDGGVLCTTVCTDGDLDTFFADCLPLDCNDGSASSFPGASEICDGLDNDCDGATDEGAVCTQPAAGEVLFTEILQNPGVVPDADGEWFELHNVTASSLSLDGCLIEDGLAQEAIVGPLPVEPGGFLVIGANGDTGVNGGVVLDYVYSTLALGNAAGSLTLRCGGEVVDTVAWDNGITFPDPSGASMELGIDLFDAMLNDIGASWCTGQTPFGAGDLGTPGATNDCDTGQPRISGDVVLNEIMQNPDSPLLDADAEWFEVANTTAGSLDLLGCEIVSAGISHTIVQSVLIPAGGLALFGANADPLLNGGLSLDYDYDAIQLGNAGDDLEIRCQGVTIDLVVYDDVVFPDPTGASMSLDPSAIDTILNDDGSRWCDASLIGFPFPYSTNNFGSPAAPNPPCGV